MKRSTVKTVAYWTTTILGPTSFVVGAILGIRQSPDVVNSIHHLGYPIYFATLLSTWKLLGAIAITAPGFPRLKEWAYAGFVFDLTGASISHAAVGDSTAEILVPLLFLGLVAASWALRPASRRLEPQAQGSVSLAIARERSAEIGMEAYVR
jgi:DoxX-like protein